MSSKPKSDRSAAIIGEAIGKISATMVDAIRKLDGDGEEIRRMLRSAFSMINAEKEHQESIVSGVDAN